MKSEIRNSQIRDLLEKVQKQNYGSYLRAMRLERIRAFRGTSISFDFPVTALIGPNGSGKSTVLGACACAYSSIIPTNVFRKSRLGDDSMDDWLVECDLVENPLNPKGTIRSKLSLTSNHWLRFPEVNRKVKQITLNRTVPAADNPLFLLKKKLSVHGKWAKKWAKGNASFSHTEISGIDDIKRESERVLGRSLEEFKLYEVTFSSAARQGPDYKVVIDKVEHDAKGREIITRRKIPQRRSPPKTIRSSQLIYVGAIDGNTYSEFNFGSGESSVIRTVADIETLPDGSLVLIEEIENGLHPLAVCRMVEYLIQVADRKRMQFVFTTHSDYALEPLPPEAIWACIDGRLQQGKLSVEVLRAVSGRVDRRLALFVEDSFSRSWIESVIREYLGASRDEVGIYPVQGDGNAVKTHRSHLTNPAVAFRSLCFIDGDSEQEEDSSAFIYRLPGDAPESTVFNAVLANLDQNIALLTAACQRPISKQDEVAKAIREVSQTNRDPHLLFNQVGIKLGFVPEVTVRGAFLAIWIEENSDLARKIVEPIRSNLKLA